MVSPTQHSAIAQILGPVMGARDGISMSPAMTLDHQPEIGQP